MCIRDRRTTSKQAPLGAAGADDCAKAADAGARAASDAATKMPACQRRENDIEREASDMGLMSVLFFQNQLVQVMHRARASAN